MPPDAPPLVSCLCVTRARVPMLERALRCFHRQTHPRRELVLLYEADDAETDAFVRILPPHRRLDLEEAADGTWRERAAAAGGAEVCVICVHARSKKTLGVLRNLSVAHAAGDYVCQWDDDWYHPERLARQLAACAAANKPACVLAQWLFFDACAYRGYVIHPRTDGWEGSLLCRRDAMPAYDDLACGEDVVVPQRLRAAGKLEVLSCPGLYVYVAHTANTCPRTHFETLAQASAPIPPHHTAALAALLAET
jgi:glycosyltransferase involved in cell wall biosynthesis